MTRRELAGVMIRAGWTPCRTAAALGATEDTIYRWLPRRSNRPHGGAMQRRRGPELSARVIEMRGRGLKAERIALLAGVSRRTVYNALADVVAGA